MAILAINGRNVIDDKRDQEVIKFMNDEKTVVIKGKFNIKRSFYRLVKSELNIILPKLQENTIYSASELMGDDLWANFSRSQQREAFLCLQHLAEMSDSKLNYSTWVRNENGFMINHHH